MESIENKSGDGKVKTILNLGAGVQSTTLYLMGVRGEIDFECAVFADLGDEPAPVYRHLEWMESLGGPKIHRLFNGKLGDHLIVGKDSNGGRFASIPAWTALSEGVKTGVVRRQCTSEYKVLPIERFIKRDLFGLKKGQRFNSGDGVVQMYGISMDEAARAWRIKQNSPHWSTPKFPLIEKMMSRVDCLKWLKAFGVPHEVPRSACVFCPYKSNKEWDWLRKNDMDGFRRAIEIDDALRVDGSVANRKLNQKLYLHKSCVPLRDAKLTDAEIGQLTFDTECEGGCSL